jgi:hypothetical protein
MRSWSCFLLPLVPVHIKKDEHWLHIIFAQAPELYVVTKTTFLLRVYSFWGLCPENNLHLFLPISFQWVFLYIWNITGLDDFGPILKTAPRRYLYFSFLLAVNRFVYFVLLSPFPLPQRYTVYLLRTADPPLDGGKSITRAIGWGGPWKSRLNSPF